MFIARTVMFVVLALSLTGCKTRGDVQLEAVQESLAQYEETIDRKALNELLEAYLDVNPWHLRAELYEKEEDERARFQLWRNLQTAVQVRLIRDQQWGALSHLSRNGATFRDLSAKALWKSYNGSDPELLELVGKEAVRTGDLMEAYQSFAAAGVADAEYASLARGLAQHYGCADLFNIWGEITKWHSAFPGESIELSESNLSHKELVKARLALRKGTPPEVPEQCPIAG